MSLKRVVTVVCFLACVGASARLAVAGPFSVTLSDASFGAGGISPVFSDVDNFQFLIDFSGPLVPGGVYDNASLVLVQYIVSGSLSLNPPTPAGFSSFRLDRTLGGGGPISPADWIGQDSSIAFEVAASADLSDGLQLSELVPDANDLIFDLNAREFERLDRARYHPPQLLLYSDGTGRFWNSNNSSGGTGTTNPGTGLTVDVDFGEEYITDLTFDPTLITIAVPEPGSLLLGVLAALGWLAGRKARAGRGARANEVG